MYDVSATEAVAGTKSIEKPLSLFSGNHGISPKTSSKYFKTGWSTILATLSPTASSIWVAKIWHPFLKLFFNCMAEISLTITTLGMP
jgi:hypothetical protein